MKNYITRFAVLLVGLVITQTAYGDVKIKSRQTMSGQSTEHTTYIKGKRQRSEYNSAEQLLQDLITADVKIQSGLGNIVKILHFVCPNTTDFGFHELYIST